MTIKDLMDKLANLAQTIPQHGDAEVIIRIGNLETNIAAIEIRRMTSDNKPQITICDWSEMPPIE